MSDHMREQFEDMMSSQGEWPQAIEKDPRGGYKFSVAAEAWETWQSAWEAGQEMMKSRVKELEAENAELRAEVYCNQMCVRFWPSHHSNCRLLAIRLNRIKQQSDDEGEA